VPCLVALPHRARSAAWLCLVASPGTVVVPCEWSIGPALHDSRTVASYPHILHALNVYPIHTSYRPMMALTSGVLGTCARVLEICEPSYIDRSARLFFIYL
jgi:hypothetical protein